MKFVVKNYLPQLMTTVCMIATCFYEGSCSLVGEVPVLSFIKGL